MAILGTPLALQYLQISVHIPIIWALEPTSIWVCQGPALTRPPAATESDFLLKLLKNFRLKSTIDIIDDIVHLNEPLDGVIIPRGLKEVLSSGLRCYHVFQNGNLCLLIWVKKS